jgi:hypothetical protein
MYSFLSITFHVFPTSQKQLPTVFDWLKQKLDTRRVRRLKKRHIGFFCVFDHRAPQEIGLASNKRGEMAASLTIQNPYVIAAGIAIFVSPPIHEISQ